MSNSLSNPANFAKLDILDHLHAISLRGCMLRELDEGLELVDVL